MSVRAGITGNPRRTRAEYWTIGVRDHSAADLADASSRRSLISTTRRTSRGC
jgi:hypothetical protein